LGGRLRVRNGKEQTKAVKTVVFTVQGDTLPRDGGWKEEGQGTIQVDATRTPRPWTSQWRDNPDKKISSMPSTR